MSFNKKGFMLFVPMIVIGSFVLLAYAAVLFQLDKPITKQTVGEIAANLIARYMDGENFMFYLDKSSEYAAKGAVYSMASKGGVNDEKCRSKKEVYNLWNKGCKPNKENFIYFFDINFRSYLDSAYSSSGLEYDYDFETGEKNIIKGLSKKPVGLSIKNKAEGIEVKEAEAVAPISERYNIYAGLINKYGQKYNVEPVVLRCMIQQESGFNTRAISPNCGAAGLIQLMPGAARDMGIKKVFNNAVFNGCNKVYAGQLEEAISGKGNEEIKKIDERFDPEKNIDAGTKYFKQQLNSFGSVKLALAAYNAGPERTRENTKIYGDNLVSYPKETQKYINNIMACISKDESKISGMATAEPEEEDNDRNIEVGVYDVNASFLTELDYDFSDYDKIYNEITLKLECLKDNYEKCFTNELGMMWDLFKEGDVIFVNVITSQKIERFNMLNDDNVIIKFGVDLNNWEEPKRVEL
ncbi:lytic transglycosylase domain-containing protein [Candidatus Woesearchaeota archaeon]|nr:lytic transglycosylase domain-containing protein [Candidatus Woesearchaeota archaeon]